MLTVGDFQHQRVNWDKMESIFKVKCVFALKNLQKKKHLKNINAWIFIFNKIWRCFCWLKYIKWLKESLTTWCTKQANLLDKKQHFTELRVICTMVGEWGKPTCQPCGLVTIHWKQSHKLKTVVWKCLITIGWNLKHRGSTLFPCYNIFLISSKSLENLLKMDILWYFEYQLLSLAVCKSMASLSDSYVEMRKEARNEKDMTFTSARNLLAILRLSTALVSM